jgi:hypothetical protein
MLHQHRAGRVEHPLGLPLGPGQPGELGGQPGVLDGDLAGVGVQVEGAALGAGGQVGVGVVDGDGQAVPLQDAGTGKAARAGADDGSLSCRSRYGTERTIGKCLPNDRSADTLAA